jgi:hypothetical protein
MDLIGAGEDGRRYLLLFGLQTIGALIIIRYAMPLYRDAVANPAGHEARLGPLLWGSTAVALMQTGFWIHHWLRPPLPQFRNALLGYVIMFLVRVSFLLATSIFAFVFITQRPEFHIPISRYLLVSVGLFSFFCYTQEAERLGKSLIEPPPTSAQTKSRRLHPR